MPWLLGQGLSGVLVGVGGNDLAEVDAVEISAGVSLLAHDLSRYRRDAPPADRSGRWFYSVKSTDSPTVAAPGSIQVVQAEWENYRQNLETDPLPKHSERDQSASMALGGGWSVPSPELWAKEASTGARQAPCALTARRSHVAERGAGREEGAPGGQRPLTRLRRDVSALVAARRCPPMRLPTSIVPRVTRGRSPRLRRAPVKMILAALLMLAGSHMPGFPQAKAQGDLPVLTREAQIRKLTAEQSRLAYPVKSRGVVAHNLPAWGVTFLQDSTGGILIRWRGTATQARAGNLAEAYGATGPGTFAPVVDYPQIRVVGKAPLPPAHRFPLDDLLRGKEDSQWV